MYLNPNPITSEGKDITLLFREHLLLNNQYMACPNRENFADHFIFSVLMYSETGNKNRLSRYL